MRIPESTIIELHPGAKSLYWLYCTMALACGSGALFAAFHTNDGRGLSGGLGLVFFLVGLVMLFRRRCLVDWTGRIVCVDFKLFGVYTVWTRRTPFSDFDKILVRRHRSSDGDTVFVYLGKRSGGKFPMRYFNVAGGSPCQAASDFARQLSSGFGLEIIEQ